MKALKDYIVESIFDVEDKVENFDEVVKIEEFCKKHNISKYEILPDNKVNILGALHLSIRNKKDIINLINLNVVRDTLYLDIKKAFNYDLLPEYVGSLYHEGNSIKNHTFVIRPESTGLVNIGCKNGDWDGFRLRFVEEPMVYPILSGDCRDFLKSATIENCSNLVIKPLNLHTLKQKREFINEAISIIESRSKYIDVKYLIYNTLDNSDVYERRGDKFILI
jgi:hypothetical protein